MSKKNTSTSNKSYTLNNNLIDFKLTRWSDMPDIGLYMDQVLVLMDKYIGALFIAKDKDSFLTPSMINNYVKLGVMNPPVSKKYSREHLAYLTIICLMKQALSISSIKILLNSELNQATIQEVYEKFCNYYEEYLTAITKNENIHLETNTSKDNILKLGIVSNICRLVSDIEIKLLEESKSNLPTTNNKKNQETVKKK